MGVITVLLLPCSPPPPSPDPLSQDINADKLRQQEAQDEREGIREAVVLGFFFLYDVSSGTQLTDDDTVRMTFDKGKYYRTNNKVLCLVITMIRTHTLKSTVTNHEQPSPHDTRQHTNKAYTLWNVMYGETVKYMIKIRK